MGLPSKRSRKAQHNDDFEDYDDDDMDNDNLSVSKFLFLFFINHSWNLINIVIGFVFLFLG